MKNRVSFFCLHTCLLLFSFWTMYPALGHAADGNVISRLKFKRISTLDGLPTDEVQKIYQDKEGFCGLLPGMVSVNTTVTRLLSINRA